LSGDFNGEDNNKSKFRKFTREAIMIRMHGAEGSTELTEQIREDLWVVASKLSCLADLADVRTPINVELDSIESLPNWPCCAKWSWVFCPGSKRS
jgi:hypothetical protein